VVSGHSALQGLISSCTLLAMKGVVPSLLDFQQQLQQQIILYCQHLSDEAYPHEEIIAIQRLLCRVVDSLAMSSFSTQGISWTNYQLGHHFFGYQHDELFNPAHSDLLFNSVHQEIKNTTLIMFALSPLSLPGKERIEKKVTVTESDVIETADDESEPLAIQVEAQGPTIRWMSLMCQFAIAGFLLGIFWYGCRMFQSGGL